MSLRGKKGATGRRNEVGPKVAASIVTFSRSLQQATQSEAGKSWRAPDWPKNRRSKATNLLESLLCLREGLPIGSREEAGNCQTAWRTNCWFREQENGLRCSRHDPGSKYDKAKELGVAILDEAGFEKLVG